MYALYTIALLIFYNIYIKCYTLNEGGTEALVCSTAHKCGALFYMHIHGGCWSQHHSEHDDRVPLLCNIAISICIYIYIQSGDHYC